MAVLSGSVRKLLERVVVEGRGVAEGAAAASLVRLGVGVGVAPAHLSEGERALRRGLRARARQLGDGLERGGGGDGDVWVRCPLLVAEVAYEQWHRILFARFLEVNELLRHPEFGVGVSLEECGQLAAELGEVDGWSVAARFAGEVLPGIFKGSDPAARVRFAREDLLRLERLVTGLPVEVFESEDALGWVYQFWQSKAKDEVNRSGRKIGGADLSPVTQLFTEDYMVRFLLENSLGAWWAGKFPESPLVKGFEFLRFGEDGLPAAGVFEGWPESVAEVTVMDPCCGSGHFLVAAFGMLWRMRAEVEGLSDVAAQDAVLAENLFGLELDPRCTQIAMFALALEAWKQGGFRVLPVPQVACSGIPAKAPLQEWTRLAEGDSLLESALGRLYALFADADTLGSLIDPIRAAEQAGLDSVDWHDIAPLLNQALSAEAGRSGDPASEVFGEAAAGIARAADYLSRQYTLIATNVPYLQRGKQSDMLKRFADHDYSDSKADLASMFIERLGSLGGGNAAIAAVTPQAWLSLGRYAQLRQKIVLAQRIHHLALLGPGGFSSISGEVVKVALFISSIASPASFLMGHFTGMDLSPVKAALRKADALRTTPLASVKQEDVRSDPDCSIVLNARGNKVLLSSYASGLGGITTGDSARYRRQYWEIPYIAGAWVKQQSTANATAPYSGRDLILRWEYGNGAMVAAAKAGRATIAGREAWGKRGVAAQKMGDLPVTLYTGEVFENVAVVIVPGDEALLPALWAYCSSHLFHVDVRTIDQSIGVTCNTLVKVPFDVERWRRVAEEQFPDGLPEPWSDDATQWLFGGVPAVARQPLQVAVARLVGFRWPDQVPDAVDGLVDVDGVVCLPAVAGELTAADRVRAVLAASFGEGWSSAKLDELLVAAGGKPGDLAGWLRDVFFKDHCRVFGNRPFVWHVWDGLRDGFSALVNYHRLDRSTLERLTYSTLGWWIDRQRADSAAGVVGADARLVAALRLQEKLKPILAGEPPYDIFVRWKSLAEQPVGWDPDLDDGVRLNIRPFVEAVVLRSKFTIHWKKDRGTNPDGSERHNDLHHTTTQKRNTQQGLNG